MPEKIVIAFGGNAILRAKQKGTSEEQRANIYAACKPVADLVAQGHQVIISHGNGPQVGAVLLQNEVAQAHTPAMPLDICGAATQGQIGYMIQQILGNMLKEQNIPCTVVSLVTQVVVNKDDSAFQAPTKPIGSFYSSEEASCLGSEKGWVMKEDIARGGWRRVVPSPDPISIVEREAINLLLDSGVLVVASGGGGIPVVQVPEGHMGVEAVIDKDLAAQRLAQDVNAQTLMILTDVSEVAVNFGTPQQENIRHMTVRQAEDYYAQGHFKAGSMGPKVLAAICFLRSGGTRSIITSLEAVSRALRGEAGTIITTT
ncbi:MAG: carbamate kinase [Bacillota bacterium]|nr:MAG: carbamate kinase [Bacillota bacterium]